MTAAAGLVLATLLAGPADAAEKRCGWVQNPTPGNFWLDDREGSWTILTQGDRAEPEGIDALPDLSAGEFVETNGHYGYACACMLKRTGPRCESPASTACSNCPSRNAAMTGRFHAPATEAPASRRITEAMVSHSTITDPYGHQPTATSRQTATTSLHPFI
ncbi:DUF4087 domain-containing protein [Rhizobium sp. RU35A]|uniref:DUF4087 domain-containing protein n=1 Tax=Rhizobium sp. RU35A TaxID=1907414 RepID=UPI0032AF7FBB